jgi:anti-sigma factor RsiW
MNHAEPHDDSRCKDLFAELSAYLDGELTPEDRVELEKHLCGCPPCIEFVQSLRRTVDLCHHYESEAAPGPLAPAARERLLAACRKMLADRPR